MNERLVELFNTYKNLRSVQDIVQEIFVVDHYVVNFGEKEAANLIDYFITKYDREIKKIGHIYKNKVVVENDPQIYEKKDTEEISSDLEYIRDCLIIIGAVQSGIRATYEMVIEEIEGYE